MTCKRDFCLCSKSSFPWAIACLYVDTVSKEVGKHNGSSWCSRKSSSVVGSMHSGMHGDMHGFSTNVYDMNGSSLPVPLSLHTLIDQTELALLLPLLDFFVGGMPSNAQLCLGDESLCCMYVCMYVFTYVCMYACMHVNIYALHIYIQSCIYFRVRIYICAFINNNVHVKLRM
jgi:hypothetical protein